LPATYRYFFRPRLHNPFQTKQQTMPKRDRSNPEDEDDEGPIDAKRVDAKPDGKDSSESDSDSESDMEVIDMEDSCGVQFVAWLEEGATCLSIGEIHFSSADQTEIGGNDGDGDEKEKDNHNEKDNQKDTDPNAYCVVCQLHLLPPETDAEEDEKDEEAPLVYTFDGGFPFKVLPVAACVPVHLDPVLSDAEADVMVEKEVENEDNGNGDGDASLSMIFRTFALEAAVHQGILEELNSSSNSNSNSNNNNNNKDDDGKEHDDDPYEKVSPDWKFTSPATDQQVVDGVRAWCKAGEDKTGWDLSKIPKTCHTTREVLVGNGGKDENEDEDHKDDDDGNVLLRLYRDLCARKSAVDADREAIEDRFEWRTSLCTYFAWAVPNAKAIRTLVDLKQPILEVGAGTGYWAWLLSQKGVDTAAYDLADSQGGQKHRFRHSIVKDGSVEQVSAPEHSNRILLVCWPDIVGDSAQDDADRGSFGTETLKTYQGDTVVHIGELESTGVAAAANGWGNPFPPGGSSTSAAFQKELVECFELKETVHLPNWPPYNSHMTVWVRKK